MRQEMPIDLVMSPPAEQWNGFYRRILIKDLRCGERKNCNLVAKKNKFGKYMVPCLFAQLCS